MRHDLPADRWTKSSYSGDTNGQCLEIQVADGGIAVGDSKDRDRGAFVFPREAWAAFVEDAKQTAV